MAKLTYRIQEMDDVRIHQITWGMNEEENLISILNSKTEKCTEEWQGEEFRSVRKHVNKKLHN